MASVSSNADVPIPNQEIEEIKRLLWGSDIKYDIFRRWTQGIIFSEEEPTALTQLEGGPCAVIAPLQAFLLKNAMFSQNINGNWREINGEQRQLLLCQTLAEMLSLVSSSDTAYLVQYQPSGNMNDNENHRSTTSGHDDSTQNAVDEVNSDQVPESSSLTNCNPNPNSSTDCQSAHVMANTNNQLSKDNQCQSDMAEDFNNGSSPKKKCLSHEEFHLRLRCRKCSSKEEVLNQLKLHVSELYNEYGVLLVLYSLVLTKGIEQIKNEVGDPCEALIDDTHGYGSQSLVNLLITGKAVSNVWDNDKDLSGLKLHGITKKATIGFLTLLEHLRYCEVGWFLKNPEVPVWILGSETHLTVLFSQEKSLVITESPEAEARRIFSNFDTEGRGFIPCDHLQDLMGALNLVAETEYVKIMQDKLDPEQLGIVTLNSFMDEFFPHDGQSDVVNTFTLMHYNGLGRSCPEGKVRYITGEATILDMPEVQILTDTSPIKTCLMTKWPTIELKWQDNLIPSLN